MSEKPSGKRKQQGDLDARLSAYFGPALREQPLSSLSWQRLRARLKRRRVSFRRMVLRWRLRQFAGRPALPDNVLDAYTDVLDAARLHYSPSLVYCRFASQRREPSVHVLPFGRCPIRLFLPSRHGYALTRSELRVVLATAVAQYRCLRGRRISNMLIAGLSIMIGLLASAAAIAGILIHLYALIPLVLLWPVIVGCLHILQRRLAMRADDLIVQWLGRSQVCQGLHLLANHSSTAYRRRWGQLSLAERIERICGIAVEARDERLTLVR